MIMCENCSSLHEGNYGSGRFCSAVCARGYSTKKSREKINEKVSETIRRTRGTEFHKCAICQVSFSWKHFREVAKSLGKNETKFCSKKCKMIAKESQNRSPEFRQKMSDSAIRRLERGEAWFGTQNFVEVFGKTIRCDSLLEKSFVLLMSRDSRVKDISRSNIWIPYVDGSITRRYNPDFLVEFVDGTFAIAEVKSERVGKNDVWEDYLRKSEIKRNLLEEYASKNSMRTIWYTQTASPKIYKEVCTTLSRVLY